MSRLTLLERVRRIASAGLCAGLLAGSVAHAYPGTDAANPSQCQEGASGFIQAGGRTICLGAAEQSREASPTPSADGESPEPAAQTAGETGTASQQ